MRHLTKSFLSIFLLSLFALPIAASVFAQTATPVVTANSVAADGLIMVCLQAKQGDCFKDNGNTCSNGPMGDHTTEVNGTGFQYGEPEKNKIEIWRKVDNVMRCAIDKSGNSTCSGSSPTLGEAFQVLTANASDIVTNQGGELSNGTGGNIIIRSETDENRVHTFYGIQVVDIGVVDVELTALKLSTFLPPGDQSNCITVKWDPRGVVFDAVSLEPIEGASVTIFDNSTKTKVPVGPGVDANPMKTGPDGSYSFIVEEGLYYLTADKNGYTFPIAETLRNTLQTSELVQSRYPNDNPKNADGKTLKFENDKNWIYLANELVEEIIGYVKYRHIPLLPKSGQTNTPPKLYDKNITSFCPSDECYQQIYGSCSHFNCVVHVYNDNKPLIDPNTSQPVIQQVDSQRKFDITIANALLYDASKEIILQAEKIDETLLTPTPTTTFQTRLINTLGNVVEFIIPSIQAATNANLSEQVKLIPIPARIEGYAYDKKLKTVPNAKVRIVVPSMNNRTIVTVQANKEGYVQVPTYVLPPVPFEIQIIDKNNKVINEMTTGKFIAANKPYLAKNNISLLTRSGAKPRIVTDDTQSSGSAATDITDTSSIPFIQTGTGLANGPVDVDNVSQNNGVDQEVTTKEPASNSTMFVLVAVAFVVVLAAIGIIMLRMRNKGPHVGNLS